MQNVEDRTHYNRGIVSGEVLMCCAGAGVAVVAVAGPVLVPFSKQKRGILLTDGGWEVIW